MQQTPPPFSAKKIAGVPAYKFARKQHEVTLKPVPVEIKEFTILDVTGDRAAFRAHVGSGTYMRSIARDMGHRLGCGAHLAELRRTSVAEFSIQDAHTLEELGSAMQQGTAEGDNTISVHPRLLLPLLPCVTVSDESAALIRTGRALNLPELSRAPRVKVFYGQRQLLAIGSRIAGTLFHPSIVFSMDNC
ncbi:MAG: tRNA pseudouridine(55) synthase, partial [Terriglobales bacterium]